MGKEQKEDLSVSAALTNPGKKSEKKSAHSPPAGERTEQRSCSPRLQRRHLKKQTNTKTIISTVS